MFAAENLPLTRAPLVRPDEASGTTRAEA